MSVLEDACYRHRIPILSPGYDINFKVEILNTGLMQGHETWYEYHILPALQVLLVKICLIFTHKQNKFLPQKHSFPGESRFP